MHSTRREDVLQTQCLACTVGKTKEVETGCKMIGFEKKQHRTYKTYVFEFGGVCVMVETSAML